MVTRGGQRDRLEPLLRCALRSRLAQDRLHLSGEREFYLTLRHRRTDGSTYLRFDPLELLERLAVLAPSAAGARLMAFKYAKSSTPNMHVAKR